MAKFIQAINAYAPKINRGKQAPFKKLVAFISDRTKWYNGQIYHYFCELKEALLYFCSTGKSVKIDGVGSFRPTISLDGEISIIYLPDPELKTELNMKNGFKGIIENAAMIGKTKEEIVARWNAEHPDDPIA